MIDDVFGPLIPTEGRAPTIRQFIIYEKSTGRIAGVEATNSAPTEMPGLVWLEVSVIPDNLSDMKVMSGGLVALSREEIEARDAPTENDLRIKIFAELAASDMTQVPDFPISDEKRAAWRVYRQALRDLSKVPGGAAEWVKRWPVRP